MTFGVAVGSGAQGLAERKHRLLPFALRFVRLAQEQPGVEPSLSLVERGRASHDKVQARDGLGCTLRPQQHARLADQQKSIWRGGST